MRDPVTMTSVDAAEARLSAAACDSRSEIVVPLADATSRPLPASILSSPSSRVKSPLIAGASCFAATA